MPVCDVEKRLRPAAELSLHCFFVVEGMLADAELVHQQSKAIPEATGVRLMEQFEIVRSGCKDM